MTSEEWLELGRCLGLEADDLQSQLKPSNSEAFHAAPVIIRSISLACRRMAKKTEKKS